MISLKWIKSLTNVYWLETNLCQHCIRNNQDLLIVLVVHLLNIVKEFKTLKTCNLKHLYRNELDKACFAHNAAYCDNKDLAKIAISDKTLKDKACKITGNCKHDQL